MVNLKRVKNKINKVLILIFILLLISSLFPLTKVSASGDVIYVKWNATGTNNGSSWANAYTSLRSALMMSSAGKEIWVASGIYRPGSSGQQSSSFALKNGVAVYGGFSGFETSKEQRNWELNISVLSGDIDLNDITNSSGVVTNAEDIRGNNSFIVISNNGVGPSAILDGFTITAGNNSNYLGKGAGMYNTSSSPTLSNITFSGNKAFHNLEGGYGAGIYNTNSNPTLINVKFYANYASYGGGIYNDYSNPILNTVTFTENTATTEGGGVYNNNSNASLENVTFIGNAQIDEWGSGGGMSNYFSNPTITNSTFIGNSAYHGGGASDYTSYPIFTDVTFSSNTAMYGGGMHNASSAPTLSNITFNGNSATDSGGGMHNYQSDITMSNITFIANSAIYGGGMANSIDGHAIILKNVTFYENSASYGGGIYADGGITIARNTILWNNIATNGSQVFGGSSLQYCVVEGGCPSGNSCNGIIDADPMLGNLGYYGGVTQTLPLQVGSYAIDRGNNEYCATTDQRGIPRWQGPDCDIGAYEVAPLVISSNRVNSNPTNSASVNYDISFSESVNGVDVTDFSLTTTNITGAIITEVNGSGSVYSVTVSTGNGIGTLRLDIIDNDTIVNWANIPLGGLGEGNGDYIKGEIYFVNHTPSIISSAITSATQDMLYSYNISASDIDSVSGDKLTITASNLPSWLTLIDNGDGTAVLFGTPIYHQVGNHSVELMVTDTGGLSDTQNFTITVSNVNDSPYFTSAPILLACSGIPYSYSILTTDYDIVYGDTLLITASSLPTWLTLNDNGDGTATISGIPLNINVGDNSVVLVVTDNSDSYSTQEFFISVKHCIFIPLVVRNIP